jgi:hypothetical protein
MIGLTQISVEGSLRSLSLNERDPGEMEKLNIK